MPQGRQDYPNGREKAMGMALLEMEGKQSSLQHLGSLN